jgi:pimeloyl-ACP methyl ester carboxylesterase
VAPAVSCTADYLSARTRRSEILGELTRLIDHLDEQNDTQYRHVHLLGYSFGSIVAIDALFRRELAVGRKMKRVNTLVTIGCPFDFVRTYWPTYFNARHAATDVPRRWVNVYCELDVLGSNFRDGDDASTPSKQRGIEILNREQRRPGDQDNLAFGPSAEEGLSFWEYARFIGFRTHSAYWDLDSENALSCFEPIVLKLYAEELALA